MEDARHRTLLAGHRVFLRPVEQGDYELIRRAELSEQLIIPFRHRGTTPSPEQFVAGLWSGVLALFMICDRRNARPLGLALAFQADHRNGHVQMAVYLFPPYQGTGWPLEGVKVFIDYLFRAFPFRKIYGAALAPNMRTYDSALRGVVKVEGCLVEHDYVDGEYVDQYILSISRADWELAARSARNGSGLLAALAAVNGSRQ